MSQRNASDELASVRKYVGGYYLGEELNNLPPLSTMTILPQTMFPSEHPYKLLIGNFNGNNDKVWLALGTTPANGQGPTVYFHRGDKDHEMKKMFFSALNTVTTLQPFRRIWEKTTNCVGAPGHWSDLRRGMVKAVGYWYLMQEAERKGEILVMPEAIRKYLVDALNRLGTKEHEVPGLSAGGRDGMVGGVGRPRIDQVMMDDAKRQQAKLGVAVQEGRGKENGTPSQGPNGTNVQLQNLKRLILEYETQRGHSIGKKARIERYQPASSNASMTPAIRSESEVLSNFIAQTYSGEDATPNTQVHQMSLSQHETTASMAKGGAYRMHLEGEFEPGTDHPVAVKQETNEIVQIPFQNVRNSNASAVIEPEVPDLPVYRIQDGPSTTKQSRLVLVQSPPKQSGSAANEVDVIIKLRAMLDVEAALQDELAKVKSEAEVTRQKQEKLQQMLCEQRAAIMGCMGTK